MNLRITIIIFAVSICGAAVCQGAGQLEQQLARLEASVAERSGTAADVAGAGAGKSQTGDPNEALESKVETLEKALVALHAELAAIKAKVESQKTAPPAAPQAQPSVSRDEVTQIVSKAIEEQKLTATDLPAWVKKLSISGDFRYRHETIDDKTASADRHRNRIRARVNLNTQVNEEVDLGIRFASGSADPVSTNQSLEDSFSSKTLWLDLAYFRWRPASVKGMSLLAGKMKNPFYRAGKNQLIWDDDLNPEGIGLQHVASLGENTQLYTNAGGFWVDESSSGVDTSLWGAQAYLEQKVGESDKVILGASYFDYGNIQGRGNLQGTWSTGSSFFGNTTSNSLFANDFDLFEVFGEYGTKIGKLPFSVYGDWVKNVRATSGLDTGWLAGCKLNKAKDPGSWELAYNYRDIEADAVLGAFTDSDFGGGGAGHKGHKFGMKYQVGKNVQTALTYLMNKKGSTEADYDRLQLDLVAKF